MTESKRNPSELIAYQIPVEQVPWNNLKSAADTLRRAFEENALMRYMMSASRGAGQKSPQHFVNILQRVRKNGIVTRTSEQHEGIAVWFLEGFARSSLSSNLNIMRHKLMNFHLIRISRLIPFYLRVEREHARIIRHPHYYLELLGVDPRFQGQGFASRLLRPVLTHADMRRKSCYLETQSAKNVSLYKHFGFEVVGEIPVFFDKTPYSLMLRKPQHSPTYF